MAVALTLTDVPASGAIQVAVAGMPVPVAGLTAPTGIVQRSGDGGITWKTVRGLAEAAIDGSGNLPTTLDDEFRTGVVNTYRVGLTQQAVDQFARTVSAGGWGSPTVGDAWTASSALLSVSTNRGRATHSAANTTVDVLSTDDYADGTIEVTASVTATITGGAQTTALYARYVDSSNFYRAIVSWSQTSGVLTLTVVARRLGVDTTLVTSALGFTHTSSTTNLRLIMTTTGTTLAVTVYSTAGAPPADPTWSGTVPLAQRIASGRFGIRSGRSTGNTNTNAQTTWADLLLDADDLPYFTLDSETLSSDVSGFWLKSTMRRFLNLTPMVVDYAEPSRTPRGGQLDVIGRSLPIGQVELMTSRSTVLTFRTLDLQAARTLEFLIASGDVLYLQTPSSCPIVSGHYRVDGDMTSVRVTPRSDVRLFTLPLREVAAPGPDVVTATSTWETVIAMFGTWEDVIAACPTWEDVLALVGDPSEVIVE